VLGCTNLPWRMKLMTVAEVTRRHLDDPRGAGSAAERDSVGGDEA
jgi:hypothetical protein